MKREDEQAKYLFHTSIPMPALIVWAGLLLNIGARADTVVSFAPEPVGSGARALGQSAFIAVADDATAASWNPAGLINMEKPEASIVGIWRTISNNPSPTDSSVVLDGADWSISEINFFSYARPIAVGNTDIVLSANYHQVYDLGLEYGTANGTVESKGAISAYSLAGGLAVPSFPELTIGAAFNWYAEGLCNGHVREVITPGAQSTTRETLDSIEGHNFTVGLLWDAYEQDEKLLTLGLVYHTPFTVEVDGKRVTVYDPEEGEPLGNGGGGRVGPIDIDFPVSLAFGANYRFCDNFSTALDLQWTDWSDHDYTGAGEDETPDSDALAVRLGCEYLWFSQVPGEHVWALRGGLFYEPRPAWDDILPVYGLSCGLGWTRKEHFSWDFAYQFRWGEGDFTRPGPGSLDYGIEEHWFISSIVWYH